MLLPLLLMSLQTPAPFGAIPNANQMAWHTMQYYAFVHFGPNTFTGEEWGSGKEKPAVFDPKKLDCRQWVRTFKEAGMTGVIITAKHHDGFCLWPSKFSQHTVAQSPWKNGKGNVLAELAAACKEVGLKLGVYLSPWDRNHPTYGTPEYNQVFANMLAEVLTNYGELFEVWFDGANGESPNGKRQEYDWDLFIATVRKYQPKAVIFGDAFDIRWVGNEKGTGSLTNWATLNRSRYVPGTPFHAELGEGTEGGPDYCPAEADVSIRPGWFWRKSENAKVKSPQQLLEIYNASVGRGCNLLLNVPPNADGLISEEDRRALLEFRKLRESAYGRKIAPVSVSTSDVGCAQAIMDNNESTFWSASRRPVSLLFSFAGGTAFTAVDLKEAVQLGQRIKSFTIEAEVKGKWQKVAEGTTVGFHRIVPIQCTTKKLRVTLSALSNPLISEISFF